MNIGTLPVLEKNRRILSLWFPRLAAERVLRLGRGLPHGPFAVVGDINNTQVLTSLSVEPEAAGLRGGQPLRDARAMCPELATKLANPQLDALFLQVLRRWAGKFSPWVSEEAPEGLVIDLTGAQSSMVFRPLPQDDPTQRKPDISRAKDHLNWEPKIALREGLQATIAYFDDLLTRDIDLGNASAKAIPWTRRQRANGVDHAAAL